MRQTGRFVGLFLPLHVFLSAFASFRLPSLGFVFGLFHSLPRLRCNWPQAQNRSLSAQLQELKLEAEENEKRAQQRQEHMQALAALEGGGARGEEEREG